MLQQLQIPDDDPDAGIHRTDRNRMRQIACMALKASQSIRLIYMAVRSVNYSNGHQNYMALGGKGTIKHYHM